MRILCTWIVLLCSFSMLAQAFTLKGRVSDYHGEALIGATVAFENQAFMTDEKGRFQAKPIEKGTYQLVVSYLGYETLTMTVKVEANQELDLHLKESSTLLDQVVVSSQAKHSVQHVDKVSNQQLVEKFAGSLAKTLESVAGVNSMDIGAGASKPVIRGLGFNRVAVAENGAKQEGQQWGADHGLEIDAFSTEEVEVIKGVGAIEYGSDAIGGVIKINNEKVPQVHSFDGKAIVYGKSVNDAVGASVQIKQRGERFFYKLKVTGQDYADYRVPIKQIDYLNTIIPIEGGRMKNTAGNNLALYGQIGYVGTQFKNILSISNVYDKSGFFPGAHGIPNIAAVQDDGNHRNVELPNQSVNHFKVTNTATWEFDANRKLSVLLAFQNNKRQENSLFHTHFSNQTPPANNPNLELEFVLNTFDAAVKYEHLFSNEHKLTVGIQQNYQNNTIGGYGFLLPKFNKFGVGAFGMYEYFVNDRLTWEAGIRADYASVHVKPFYDEILYDYLIDRGQSIETATNYAQRSQKQDRHFSSFNGMIGAKFDWTEHFNIAATIGTNFRFPTAIELASNGVHHGAFRHEKGNPDLDPEKGIALDFRATYETKTFSTTISPYAYYFTNYIFLKPSGTFSILPDSGQIYEYTQSKALITGFEWKAEQRLWDRLTVEGVFEFIYNKQIDNGKNGNYPLPFSTPANFFGQLSYTLKDWKVFQQPEVFVNGKWYAEQKRIAQGEEVTPSSQSYGLGLSSTIQLGSVAAKASLTATNIFDAKILNHMSFYRPLGIPELGRSIQLMIQIPF